MAEYIKIGSTYVPTESILDISEKSIHATLRIKNNNASFFERMAGQNYQKEEHTYRALVLKVDAKAVTPSFTPRMSMSYVDEDDGRSYGGTTVLSGPMFYFFTVYSDPDFLDTMQALKKELSSASEQRSAEIIRTLSNIGMSRILGGWEEPNYLQTRMLLDPDVKSKQDFIRKYMG